MKVLMSRDNPDGRKLEDLLKDIVDDLKEKVSYLEVKYSEEKDEKIKGIIKRAVINNNGIIARCKSSIVMQNDTMKAFDLLGKNKGASKPRL